MATLRPRSRKNSPPPDSTFFGIANSQRGSTAALPPAPGDATAATGIAVPSISKCSVHGHKNRIYTRSYRPRRVHNPTLWPRHEQKFRAPHQASSKVVSTGVRDRASPANIWT